MFFRAEKTETNRERERERDRERERERERAWRIKGITFFVGDIVTPFNISAVKNGRFHFRFFLKHLSPIVDMSKVLIVRDINLRLGPKNESLQMF